MLTTGRCLHVRPEQWILHEVPHAGYVAGHVSLPLDMWPERQCYQRLLKPCVMINAPRCYIRNGADVSQYKAVLLHMNEDDWDAFREFYMKGQRSARVRELIRQEVEALTREEVKAQQLAGLAEG